MPKRDREGNLKLKLSERLALNVILKSEPMKNFFANWKTSLSGVGLLLGGLGTIATTLSDGFQTGEGDVLMQAGAAVAAGFGLVFARDADKTSEQSGAKKP